MIFKNVFCICDDCGQTNFGNLPIKQACHSHIFSSEICGIIFLPSSAQRPTDWTTFAGWQGVIDNNDLANSSAKYLEGVGNLPLPEKNQYTSPKGVIKNFDKLYNVDFEVYDGSVLMHNFLKKLNCYLGEFTFWIHTVSDHILGSPYGITPSLTDADSIFQSGEESIQQGLVNLKWRAGCIPEKVYIEEFANAVINNPLTENTLGSDPDNVWGSDPDNVWGI